MERGIWRPTVHGVAESDMTEHTYKHTHTYAHTHTHTPHIPSSLKAPSPNTDTFWGSGGLGHQHRDLGGNPTQPITKVFETAKLFLKLGFFCILSTLFQEWSYQHLSRGMADLEFYPGSKNFNSNLILQVIFLVPEEGFTLGEMD